MHSEFEEREEKKRNLGLLESRDCQISSNIIIKLEGKSTESRKSSSSKEDSEIDNQSPQDLGGGMNIDSHTPSSLPLLKQSPLHSPSQPSQSHIPTLSTLCSQNPPSSTNPIPLLSNTNHHQPHPQHHNLIMCNSISNFELPNPNQLSPLHNYTRPPTDHPTFPAIQKQTDLAFDKMAALLNNITRVPNPNSNPTQPKPFGFNPSSAFQDLDSDVIKNLQAQQAQAQAMQNMGLIQNINTLNHTLNNLPINSQTMQNVLALGIDPVKDETAANLTHAELAGKTSGRWTKEEHHKFIIGLTKYGKDWKKVEDFIGTRTGAQIRSHAQKFFNRVQKEFNIEDPAKFVCSGELLNMNFDDKFDGGTLSPQDSSSKGTVFKTTGPSKTQTPEQSSIKPPVSSKTPSLHSFKDLIGAERNFLSLTLPKNSKLKGEKSKNGNSEKADELQHAEEEKQEKAESGETQTHSKQSMNTRSSLSKESTQLQIALDTKSRSHNRHDSIQRPQTLVHSESAPPSTAPPAGLHKNTISIGYAENTGKSFSYSNPHILNTSLPQQNINIAPNIAPNIAANTNTVINNNNSLLKQTLERNAEKAYFLNQHRENYAKIDNDILPQIDIPIHDEEFKSAPTNTVLRKRSNSFNLLLEAHGEEEALANRTSSKRQGSKNNHAKINQNPLLVNSINHLDLFQNVEESAEKWLAEKRNRVASILQNNDIVTEKTVIESSISRIIQLLQSYSILFPTVLKFINRCPLLFENLQMGCLELENLLKILFHLNTNFVLRDLIQTSSTSIPKIGRNQQLSPIKERENEEDINVKENDKSSKEENYLKEILPQIAAKNMNEMAANFNNLAELSGGSGSVKKVAVKTIKRFGKEVAKKAKLEESIEQSRKKLTSVVSEGAVESEKEGESYGEREEDRNTSTLNRERHNSNESNLSNQTQVSHHTYPSSSYGHGHGQGQGSSFHAFNTVKIQTSTNALKRLRATSIDSAFKKRAKTQ